jgi:hypothetical protein
MPQGNNGQEGRRGAGKYVNRSAPLAILCSPSPRLPPFPPSRLRGSFRGS